MRQHGEPGDVVSLFGLESIADGRKALADNQRAAQDVGQLIVERISRGESADAVARERRRLECVQSRIAALERFVADRVQGRIAAGAQRDAGSSEGELVAELLRLAPSAPASAGGQRQRDPGPGAALVAELLRLAPSARPAPAQPPAQHAGGSEAELAAELMQFQSTVPPGGQPPERFIVPSGGRT